MMSLRLHVAAGEQDAARRAIGEHGFEERVLLRHGLLLPTVIVHGDAALPSGCHVLCIDGARGTVGQGPLLDGLWQAVEARAADLLDDAATRVLLDLLHDSHPVLVEAARARFDLSFVRRRLQALLAEGIAIVDLRTILEALLLVRGYQAAPPTADETALAPGEATFDREVRSALRHAIVSPLTTGGWLEVHLLDERWRAALAAPLGPAEQIELRRAVAAALGDARQAVLLTDAQTRPVLRQLLIGQWPRLSVLAFSDLPLDLNIRPLDPIA